jgi:hypothetical protein
VSGGTLNMTGRNIGTYAAPITTINLTSGSLTNAARIAGRTINIGAATVGGSPTYVIADGGTLSAPGGLAVGSGQGIGGGGAAAATVNGNVTVNSVAPGYITTDLSQESMCDQYRELLLSRQFIRRPGRADEVAQLVTFLCTEAAGYITGQNIIIDGGLSVQLGNVTPGRSV